MATSTQCVTTISIAPHDPDEVDNTVWHHIASFMEPQTLDAFACTCQRFRTLTTFSAYTMTIDDFKSMLRTDKQDRQNILRVILPHEVGAQFKANESSANKLRILRPITEPLQKKFPNHVRVVVPGADVDKADKVRVRWVARTLVAMGCMGGIEPRFRHRPDDILGNTALHWAVRNTGNAGLIELLLRAGVKVNKTTLFGQIPLYIAMSAGNTEIVELLLRAGADANRAEDVFGRTPLYWAIQLNRADIAELLIRFGADVDKDDQYARTPLHLAAGEGHEQLVALFLKCGANVCKTNTSYNTPLAVARQAHPENHELIALLESATALHKKKCTVM